MNDAGRVASSAGLVAVGVAAVAIVGAVLASPSFAFSGNALSDLGQPGNAAATPLTTLLFDGGLITAGIVGLPFGVRLWSGSDHPLERVAAVPFVTALLGMAGVGLFPAGQALHVPAALTLYLGSMVAMACYAAGNAAAGARRRAAGTATLVAAHVAVWWWWAAGGSVTRPGLAVPETVGAVIFAGWVCWTARREG
ncbi:DUF998 domain-containing protein [Haloarcula sp. S1CR25-12]|uniref:DUF998 domain-containing protein n=1 Tax=Haloarcula saliterrae TaxID=2950534 RepID=A0ABU2F844_9EURY|nr:DUF998 domain-containing protein [Haloarcula sp. S1CR25-12]MDS0258409.1 DUF998 domain-containing protein [Haloarcula sp. S1CR25-12]